MDEDSTCHDEEAHFAVVKNSCTLRYRLKMYQKGMVEDLLEADIP